MGDDLRFSALAWLRGVLSQECTLDPQESMVLLSIVRRCDSEGRAFPGIGTICQDTRVSRSKTIEAIAEVEARGLLVRERQTRGAGLGSNRYLLQPEPAPSALGGLPRLQRRPRTSAPGGLASARGGLPVVRPADLGSAPGGPYLTQYLPKVTTQGSDPTSHSSVVTAPSFNLVPSGAEKKSANKNSKREPTAPVGGTSPGHTAVTAHYFAVFEAKRGCKPIFAGAEGKAVAALLEKLKGDVPECCRRIDNAFSSFRGGSVTIREVAANPDAFTSAETPRGRNGHPRPVQNNGTDPLLGARTYSS